VQTHNLPGRLRKNAVPWSPGLQRLRKKSLLFGQKSVAQGLESLRENAVLEEGHGFSRAVNDTAIDGFSRWGTFFPFSNFLMRDKRCPQGLKPSSMSPSCGEAAAMPFRKTRLVGASPGL
jgi:hypothetical protein